MKEPCTIFTYTARRGGYITTAGTLTFLMLSEGGLVGFLIILFVHNGLLKALFLSIMTLFYCLLLSIWFPLWTRHQLTATHLHLYYGLMFRTAIPRASITSVQATHERLNMLEPLQARFDAQKGRVKAAFSDQGQVLLHLDKPRALKIGFSTVLAESLLINVDRRDELLAALSVSPVISATQIIVRSDGRAPALKPFVPLSSGHDTSLSATPAIFVAGLTRRFGNFMAVDNLHMSIQPGEIYGFLGSNGAGKTTTLKMLAGLLQPDEGRALIAGHDAWSESLAAKAALGYVADRSLLYERLKGREFLAFLAQLRGLPLKESSERIAYLLDLLELDEHADRLCGAYSFGMKRKLSLAGALLHSPSVLLLDEPLNGLDPRSARRLKDLFGELSAQGTTILLSTHDLATAEAVCHRVGILHRGCLLAEGSTPELRQLASASDLEAVFLSLTADAAEEVQV